MVNTSFYVLNNSVTDEPSLIFFCTRHPDETLTSKGYKFNHLTLSYCRISLCEKVTFSTWFPSMLWRCWLGDRKVSGPNL